MSDGPKLLLIDGNNMCHRVFWANKNLSHKGKQVNVLFGFFKQLIHLHKSYPEHFRIIVWDGGYERRLRESTKAVESGLIESAYKANRAPKDDKHAEERERLFEQMAELEIGLDLVRCIQVKIDGVEADDIIGTYAGYAHKWRGEALIVSSDRDFCQVIGPNVKIYDAMKKEIWDVERFQMEFGFDPPLWVDAGAIMGDTSDNIHGVPGWGPKTACKYVREFGDIDKIRTALAAKKKRGKKEDDFLASDDILNLAMSLKKMDNIDGLPRPRVTKAFNPKDLEKFFLEWGFASLLKEIKRLV